MFCRSSTASREALIDQSNVADLRTVHESISEASFNTPIGIPDPSSVKIIKYSDNAVTIEVNADAAGIVVLHDLFYPGWEVRVDGELRRLLKANILFRGVEIPAGRHRIDFDFRPLSFANLSAAVSNVLHRANE